MGRHYCIIHISLERKIEAETMVGSGVLLLLLLLLCTGCCVLVQEGADVVFPCHTDRLPQCSEAVWIYAPDKSNCLAIKLFIHGQPGPNVPSHLSNRLGLTEDCALKIQHVLPDESGLYHCFSLDEPSPPVSLSVVSLIEEEERQGSELWCEVSSVSVISMRWLYQGRSVDSSEILIRHMRKASVLSLPKKHFLYQVKHLLECEVTEHGKFKQIFGFGKTPEAPEILCPDGSTNSGLKLRYLVVSVLLSSLLLGLSGAVLYTYISGRKRKSDQRSEEAVFYENIRESSAALRILTRCSDPPSECEGPAAVIMALKHKKYLK